MNICDICKHLQDETGRLLATDKWVVTLAPDQGYLGRCYVTLRSHKGSLSELTNAEWQEYIHLVPRLEKACRQAFNASPFNWACMMNNSYQAMPANPHVHWHFRPRYAEPVTLAGVRFADPQFEYHYDCDQRRTVEPDVFNAIYERLLRALND